MPEESLFRDPQHAVDSIKAEEYLIGTARRAIHATLWIGAHFGYQLEGAPMGVPLTDELREKFLKEVHIILPALREYDKYYPKLDELDLEDTWELDPATSNFTLEEILAIDYRHLRFFLHINGLRNQPPATS